MNDQSSPLAQRVRKLLGTGALQGEPPASPPNGPPPPDTGALFESQIGRLSSALRDLRSIDRQREAELRALRERLAIVEAVHRHTTAQRLASVLRELDALIDEAARLLQPAPELPPGATPFERMQARATSRGLDGAQRAALMAWASGLAEVRAQLAAILDE